MIKKFEELREKIEIGRILTDDEIKIITETFDISKGKLIHAEREFNEMFKYACDKKTNARENNNWEEFDSYDNLLNKITTTIELIFLGGY